MSVTAYSDACTLHNYAFRQRLPSASLPYPSHHIMIVLVTNTISVDTTQYIADSGGIYLISNIFP